MGHVLLWRAVWQTCIGLTRCDFDSNSWLASQSEMLVSNLNSTYTLWYYQRVGREEAD